MDKIILEGSHSLIGKKLGKYFKDKGSSFPLKLSKLQIEQGKKCRQVLQEYFPKVIAEIDAINTNLMLDRDVFYGLLNCMGSCLTIREGHNVEVRGCTAAVINHNGFMLYGRDNDLPPYLKNVSKSILYKPTHSRSFILNTSSFVNGEEGLNEDGLLVAMTFVVPKKSEIKPGFTSLFLVRYLLEYCSNVDEALSEINRLPIASSCNILVADKEGKMAVAECNPYKINVRLPETNSFGDEFIVTVNHFTSESMITHDGSNRNVYSSEKRYETAYQSLKKGIEHDPLDYMKLILRGEKGFMCQYSKSIKFETIWSTIFEIQNNVMYLSEGDPRHNSYVKSNLFRKDRR